MKFYITAIGTDCGKTLVSSIFCEALKADYWKPVQTGKESDAESIKNLVSFPVKIFPETYHLKEPVSPHQAALLEDCVISLHHFALPLSDNHLVIEGAGGILVPLNEKGDYLLDFVRLTDSEVVLVIRLYLGCINHALLSINELKRRNVNIKGLVFSGNDTFGAIKIIQSVSLVPVLLHINEEADITRDTVARYSQLLNLL